MVIREFRKRGRAFVLCRCTACSAEYECQERVLRHQARWPGLCRSCATRSGYFRATTPPPRYKCTGCAKTVSRGYTKCRSCGRKGPIKPIRQCCDCSAPLTRLARKRCLPCHNIAQNKGKSRKRTLFNLSAAWRRVRTACFERDNFTCTACRQRGGYLHAHHVRSYKAYPELRLALENLATMCRDCHNDLHGLSKRTVKAPRRRPPG